jgi:uncharacterized protein (TIGR02646 family)
MRRVIRLPLAEDVEEELNQKQANADRKRMEGALRVNDEWQTARQSKPLLAVLATLRQMMGERERCMYCLDSHGTDIEHFWPKMPYSERMFLWPNLLLCCAECGRLKGNRFPLVAGQPMLIDPTAEEPWQYLDFDPTTGNVVARFDLDSNNWSPKGQGTVELLQLDRREALAVGYRRTYRRLAALVERYLNEIGSPADSLVAALRDADDHGLMGWCFMGTGRNSPPFRDLCECQPEVWAVCLAACQ